MGNIRNGGTVQLVDQSGGVVVSGSCAYRESVSRAGMKSWRGQLTHLTPEVGLVPDAFEMRFEDGRVASVIVNNVKYSSGHRTVATFLGNGDLPRKRTEHDDSHSEGHQNA